MLSLSSQGVPPFSPVISALSRPITIVKPSAMNARGSALRFLRVITAFLSYSPFLSWSARAEYAPVLVNYAKREPRQTRFEFAPRGPSPRAQQTTPVLRTRGSVCVWWMQFLYFFFSMLYIFTILFNIYFKIYFIEEIAVLWYLFEALGTKVGVHLLQFILYERYLWYLSKLEYSGTFVIICQ